MRGDEEKGSDERPDRLSGSADYAPRSNDGSDSQSGARPEPDYAGSGFTFAEGYSAVLLDIQIDAVLAAWDSVGRDGLNAMTAEALGQELEGLRKLRGTKEE